MNKKAQGLNVTVIIIVILAILVLVIIAAAFTGGMKEMVDKIKASLGMYTAADTEEATGMCDLWCSQELYGTWCTYEFKLGETKKTCEGLGATCAGNTKC